MIESYPYSLFTADLRPVPLFERSGDPYWLCLSAENGQILDLDPKDPAGFQKVIDRERTGLYSWGLAPYLEKRELILRHYPQMVKEERFYHLGVDIVLKQGTQLSAPLGGIVAEAGYEPGEGNYGGYVILEHTFSGSGHFYTLYGHLDPESVPGKGERLSAGDSLGRIGGFSVNGGWYTQTHLQIITESGADEGYLSKGYCSEYTLKRIHLLCPSPVPLLIWSIT